MARTSRTHRVPLSVRLLVRLANAVVEPLLRLGLPLGRMTLLTVRGRKSGLPRTTPVALVQEDGRRWLIAPFGETDWARNLAAAGRARLTRGRRAEAVSARRLGPQEAAPVLQRTLPGAPRLVRGYFEVAPEAPLDRFEQEARRHPVFELAAPGGRGPGRPGLAGTRCPVCRRTRTDRSGAPFAGHRWPPAVILTVVRWYFRYRLSLADVCDLLAERGIDISPRTVLSWAHRFGLWGAFAWSARWSDAGAEFRVCPICRGAIYRAAVPAPVPARPRGLYGTWLGGQQALGGRRCGQNQLRNIGASGGGPNKRTLHLPLPKKPSSARAHPVATEPASPTKRDRT